VQFSMSKPAAPAKLHVRNNQAGRAALEPEALTQGQIQAAFDKAVRLFPDRVVPADSNEAPGPGAPGKAPAGGSAGRK